MLAGAMIADLLGRELPGHTGPPAQHGRGVYAHPSPPSTPTSTWVHTESETTVTAGVGDELMDDVLGVCTMEALMMSGEISVRCRFDGRVRSRTSGHLHLANTMWVFPDGHHRGGSTEAGRAEPHRITSPRTADLSGLEDGGGEQLSREQALRMVSRRERGRASSGRGEGPVQGDQADAPQLPRRKDPGADQARAPRVAVSAVPRVSV